MRLSPLPVGGPSREYQPALPHASRTTPRARRRAVLAATFVAILGTLVLIPGPSSRSNPPSRLDQEPPHPHLRLRGRHARPRSRAATDDGSVPRTTTTTNQATGQAADQGRLQASATGVADFGLIAVKLHTPRTRTCEVRVHYAGGWSNWRRGLLDGDDAPDADSAEAAHARRWPTGPGCSEPIWVGRADGYEDQRPGRRHRAPPPVVRAPADREEAGLAGGAVAQRGHRR